MKRIFNINVFIFLSLFLGLSEYHFDFKTISDFKALKPVFGHSVKYTIANDQQTSCLECHAELMSEEEKHSPARKNCQRCHISNGEDHPGTGKVTEFALKSTPPELCYECHDPKNEETYVHKPTEEGKCTTCHSPHSSPYLYLVKADPVSSLCYECHELKVPDGHMVHGAIDQGECQKCHNPHQSENEKFLGVSQSGMCRSCHRDVTNLSRKANVHAPFKRKCLDCHNGHSSKEAHLTDKKPKELCLSCHEDTQHKLENSKVVHGAIDTKESCINCHSPHASDHSKMLLDEEKKVCLSCHNSVISGKDEKIENIGKLLSGKNHTHQAIEENGCTKCHQPHNSENIKLFTKSFPSGTYSTADPENFELCFQCHNQDIITNPEGETVTNFRDGQTNLHFTHINGEKGRSCTVCHNTHGAASVYLIENTSMFGNWEMPIRFQLNESGGSCNPGCHEQKSYKRMVIPDFPSLQGMATDTIKAPKKP